MKRSLMTLMSFIAIAIAIATPLQASAASNSLGVNPRRDYVIKPGEKVSDTLYVTNLSKTEDLVINIRAVDFGPKNKTGSPNLLLKQTEPTRWSLKPYLTVAKDVTIPAGKSADVPFTVSIPANVGAGSYYSAIQYSTGRAGSETNLSLTSSSATLMFVRVPGEAKSSLVLDRFGVFTPDSEKVGGVYGSFFSATAPKYLAVELTNKGNVAEQPSGSIIVKDIFGKEVKTYEKVNPNNNVVLIEQTRRLDVCLNEEFTERKDKETNRTIEETICHDSNLKPGRYTADLTMLYGDNGNSSQEVKSSATFWYLPVWFLALVALGLTAVTFAVLYVLRKLKRGGRRNR